LKDILPVVIKMDRSIDLEAVELKRRFVDELGKGFIKSG
jgi:hypothetical protein